MNDNKNKEIMSKIILNKKYMPLFKNSDRYYIVTGGRGSSKSFSISSWILLTMLFETGHTVLFTRFTMTSAHLSIIPEFLEKIELLDKRDEFYITKDSIVNRFSGSSILFRGLSTSSGDQTANLKSLNGVTIWCMDESEELVDENIFDKINLSVRSRLRPNKIVLILNPRTKEHWIYKRFFESTGIEPGSNLSKNNITYIHTTYLDNIKNLDKSFLEVINNIKINEPSKYDSVILGGWLDKADGVVITNWEFGDFNPNSLQSIFGQDYGFSIDPTTLVEVAIDRNKKIIYVKEYCYNKGMTTTDIFDINKLVAGYNLIVGDSAEPRLIEELRIRGNNIIAVSKGPGSINAGIAILQDYKIIVEHNSLNIAKEFNNYVYSNRAAKLFVDKDNHIIDAIRYAVYQSDKGGTGVYNF